MIAQYRYLVMQDAVYRYTHDGKMWRLSPLSDTDCIDKFIPIANQLEQFLQHYQTDFVKDFSSIVEVIDFLEPLRGNHTVRMMYDNIASML